MTMWLFDNGSSLSTVANGNDSVTHNISSSSTSDTGTYYCIATIDGMNETSDVYTLFGESYVSVYGSTFTEEILQMYNSNIPHRAGSSHSSIGQTS